VPNSGLSMLHVCIRKSREIDCSSSKRKTDLGKDAKESK
jgi:hypothetical protein